MPDSLRHTFPKAGKLKSRKQIDLLFREGKSFFAPPVKCYYLLNNKPLAIGNPVNQEPDFGETQTTNMGTEAPTNPDTPKQESGSLKPETQTFLTHTQQNINLKAGFSVSKKQFKHSVDRNRVKRLMREAYRLHKNSLEAKLSGRGNVLEVFFVFTERSLPAFSVVQEKMKYCLRRLAKIVEGGS